MSEKKTYKAWGYSKDDAKIFEVTGPGQLPDGYYDSPANIPADKPKKKPAAKKPATDTAGEEE